MLIVIKSQIYYYIAFAIGPAVHKAYYIVGIFACTWEACSG